MDDNENCAGWADAGECTLNPEYMTENCEVACRNRQYKDKILAEEIESKVGHIESFYELEADDIDKNLIEFDQFKGKVVVITNVASYCGYTESHYRGLVELYNRFKASAVAFEILAFPCNQFGKQEPDRCMKIKRFAAGKGAEFKMMYKVDVNGLNAHPVYHWLKKVAGPPEITWNFATYYVVTPSGEVSSYNGVEPGHLVPAILEAMGANDSSDDADEEEEVGAEGEL